MKDKKVKQDLENEEQLQENPEAVEEAQPEVVESPEQAKITELTNDLQRTRADFENYRRQTEVQREQYGEVIKQSTIAKVLPLLDDIDRAIKAQPEVMGPLVKNFEKTLKSLSLEKIEPAAGEEFNPDLHNAVMVEGDGDEETIAEVLQPGYYYEGHIVRTAMVKVAKN
ncbi:MAG: nucleotide exchange factor GrpE [Candidatus Saccharibacteria bacterium]|nr:nucleotide exchange factor GrpE [Candidatus Saccharibacteria bacterium]